MITKNEKKSELLQNIFTESDLIFLTEFENEISYIHKQISTLKQYKDIITEQIKKEKTSKIYSDIKNSEKILDLVNKNIKNLLEMENHLKSFHGDLVNFLVAVENDSTDNSRFEKNAKYIQTLISEYSQELKETENALHMDISRVKAYISKLNKTNIDSSLLSSTATSANHKKKVKTKNKTSDINSSDVSLVFNSANIKDNSKLIISDKRRKVFLPFTISELDEYISNPENHFSTYEEVISQEYIIPIGRFTKNTVVARFRETYNLIRDKESKSVFEAIKRGLELMFTYNLNAAIIAACRNEDDLNNYLFHLKRKTTENFDRFKIIYEVSPFKISSFLFKSSLD